MRILNSIQKQLTYASTTSTYIGAIPANAFVVDIVANVGTAFNASGVDTLDIGTSSNQIYFAKDIDVSSKGFPTVTKQATGAGVQSTTDQTFVYAKVIPGSTDASAGSVNVCISYAYNE